MSGTELIERARQIRPGLAALIITGYADEQSISRRPDDVQVIAKPFGPEQIRTAIGAAAVAARDEETAVMQPLRAQV